MIPSTVPLRNDAECVLQARATLGEGPVWDSGRQVCWWVDITEGRLHQFDPASGRDEAFRMPEMVTTAVICTDGRLLLTLSRQLAVFDPKTAELTPVSAPIDAPDGVRFNDGACDQAGRFWVGTMHTKAVPHQGALFCYEAGCGLRRVIEPVTISNGLGWSPDGDTFYYVDTPTQQVAAFDFEPETGRVSNRRAVVEVPPERGCPDGLAVDRDGMLWVAEWGGARVVRWDPRTGQALQHVPLPVTHVTSCAFGGPALDQLYITTAREGLSAEALAAQPLAGGLFRVPTDTVGLEAVPFAGPPPARPTP